MSDIASSSRECVGAGLPPREGMRQQSSQAGIRFTQCADERHGDLQRRKVGQLGDESSASPAAS